MVLPTKRQLWIASSSSAELDPPDISRLIHFDVAQRTVIH